MSFLLDTNICSAHLKGDRNVFNRCVQHSGGLHVSSITVGELYSWVFRSKSPPDRLAALEEFFHDVMILDLDATVARTFGQLRAALLDAGRPTPEVDLLIASTAVYHDLTLVTHNVRDFAHISGLRVEDWITP